MSTVQERAVPEVHEQHDHPPPSHDEAVCWHVLAHVAGMHSPGVIASTGPRARLLSWNGRLLARIGHPSQVRRGDSRPIGRMAFE